MFQACIDNVRASLDDGAVKVLKAKLDATRGLEKIVKTEKSGKLPIFYFILIFILYVLTLYLDCD